jgi:hypothetical protein
MVVEIKSIMPAIITFNTSQPILPTVSQIILLAAIITTAAESPSPITLLLGEVFSFVNFFVVFVLSP